MKTIENSPIPLLHAFEEEHIDMRDATALLFAMVDIEGSGTREYWLQQETALDDKIVRRGVKLLLAHDLIKPGDGHQYTSRTRYVPTSALIAQAEGHNELFADLAGDRLPGETNGEDVRKIALGRLAMGYQLGISPLEEGPILAAAHKAGMGHPAGITHRALAAFTLMERIFLPVEREIQDLVRSHTA